MGIVGDSITYTSDSFDAIYAQVVRLIDLGLAYADDTLQEQVCDAVATLLTWADASRAHARSAVEASRHGAGRRPRPLQGDGRRHGGGRAVVPAREDQRRRPEQGDARPGHLPLQPAAAPPHRVRGHPNRR